MRNLAPTRELQQLHHELLTVQGELRQVQADLIDARTRAERAEQAARDAWRFSRALLRTPRGE
jgi:hypothetical protein